VPLVPCDGPRVVRDPVVAELINDAFVPVKVDREEHPDIDAQYMRVCQMITGSGGWPLTIIMTHDKLPFYAATYIPRESRFGRIGLTELVRASRKSGAPAGRTSWHRQAR